MDNDNALTESQLNELLAYLIDAEPTAAEFESRITDWLGESPVLLREVREQLFKAKLIDGHLSDGVPELGRWGAIPDSRRFVATALTAKGQNLGLREISRKPA